MRSARPLAGDILPWRPDQDCRQRSAAEAPQSAAASVHPQLPRVWAGGSADPSLHCSSQQEAASYNHNPIQHK